MALSDGRGQDRSFKKKRKDKKTMKVNGRNYLVIATFPGINGEAGNIPPLDIWVMYKEAVRCSYIQYIDSFRDQNGAFDNIPILESIDLAGNCC